MASENHKPRPYFNPELLSPAELEAYRRMMRDDLHRRAQAAREPGKVLGLLKRIQKIPNPVNEADVWQLADKSYATVALENLESPLGAVTVAMWHIPATWTSPEGRDQADAYVTSRKPKDGRTKADYNKKKAGDPVVVPSQRPITEPRGAAKRLRAFLKFHRAQGRRFTVTFDMPNGRATVTNACEWADATWLQSLPRTANRELRAFESMHFLPIQEADVREARVSWVQRRLGVPVLMRPDGRFTLLGPYFREIENHAEHRRRQCPNDPDPLLFPATRHYWKTRDKPEEPMTTSQQRTRLGRVYNLKKISPKSVLLLGRANAVADGAPVDYLAQSLGLTSADAVQDLEGFHRRVLHGIRMGTAKGLGDPRDGRAPPGKAMCFSCGTVQDVTRTMCVMEDCSGELRAHFTPSDRAKWQAHRALDTMIHEVLRQTDDDRWHAYAAAFGGAVPGRNA